MDNRNGSLVLLDKSLKQVQVVSPLKRTEQTKNSPKQVPNYSTPEVPKKVVISKVGYQLVTGEFCALSEDEDEPQEENIELDIDDEDTKKEGTDYCTLKREMARLCVSPVMNPDQTITVRMAWCWNTSIHIAVFHHTESKFELQEQYRHKLAFHDAWDVGYTELLNSYCESAVRLAMHENDLIVAVDTQGGKTASSFIHILDISSGKFLWRYEDEFIWYVSATCIYDHVYYFTTGNGDIVALDLHHRRYHHLTFLD